MSDVGTHSKPLDGTVTANGRELAPFTIAPAFRVQRLAPVPRQQDDEPGKARRAMAAVSAHRAWLAAVPVVLVNAVAFWAQLGFWQAHLPVLAQAVMVALALESIAVYLAWLAHLAQLAGDSALRLRLSAYGMALLIGALNYSHFDGPGWRPTVPAVTFGMMSAISPWLWSAYSRRQSRDILKAAGDIEPHAVRLGTTRWLWHPRRSCQVMFRATWKGVTKPAEAIALLADDAPAVTAEPAAAVTAVTAPAVTPARGGAPRRQLTRKRAEEMAAAQGVSVSTIYRRNRAAKT